MAEVFQKKQGYKYTEEFGYIPEDWEYIRLSDVFDFIAGGDVDKAYFSPYWTNEYCYPIYSNTLEYEGLYGWSSTYTINKDAITITGRGEVGHVFYHEANFTPIIRLVTGTAKRKVNVKSLSYFMKKIKFRNESTGIPQLTVPQVQKYMIAYPSDIDEQEKIAEVLGDIDSLIDKTQQLINKKKDIKTAAMQKLLTPKDGWTGFKLGNCTNICTGNENNENKIVDGLYPFFVRSENVEKINTFAYDGEAILIPGEGGIGKIFHYINGKFNYHQRVYKISDFKFINGKYTYYYMYKHFGKYALSNTVKATVDSLRLPTFEEFVVYAPKLDIQKQIADILSDMDAEIEVLKKELSKYQDLKTGMMQQLLTGKIRLLNKTVEDDSNIISLENISLKKEANNEFKDAILISILAYKYGTEQYPLGAFRRQKLSYFYKRHANMNIAEYTKKAMGPYNSKMKYQGAENIAIRNQYVRKVGNRGIVATKLISKAKEYYNKYYNASDMQWLDTNFHYESNNNLEVLATIDYAINDLVGQGKDITLENIKAYIASDKEWKPKLNLDYFTDEAIIKAMEKIKKLFNSY